MTRTEYERLPESVRVGLIRAWMKSNHGGAIHPDAVAAMTDRQLLRTAELAIGNRATGLHAYLREVPNEDNTT